MGSHHIQTIGSWRLPKQSRTLNNSTFLSDLWSNLAHSSWGRSPYKIKKKKKKKPSYLPFMHIFKLTKKRNPIPTKTHTHTYYFPKPSAHPTNAFLIHLSTGWPCTSPCIEIPHDLFWGEDMGRRRRTLPNSPGTKFRENDPRAL